MKLAVFGLGYVGTVTAAVLAEEGHDVVGVDVDPTKARLVADGRSPVLEPGLDGLVRSGVVTGRLRATTSAREAVAGAELSLVCVGTPSSAAGATDLRYVERAVSEISAALAGGIQSPSGHHAIVVRSTVPPGTVDRLRRDVVEGATGLFATSIGTGMCPEFLREGSAIADFYDSPLCVLGTDDPLVADTMRRLFHFLPAPLRVVGTPEAEALKYACNAFHATKVAFANEVGRLFRHFGVDTRRVMELFCQDTKLNVSPTYLSPGFAFGGSCLPKDLRSMLHLARTSFVDLPLLAGTLATNDLSVDDVVNRVIATDARTVAILGLSFKMHSDDLRESPYVELAETLIGKGFDVRIYDPLVDTARLVGANRLYLVSKLPHVQRVLSRSACDALRGAEVAVVSSSDRTIVEALVEATPATIIDCSGCLGAAVERLPSYEGVAW
jgi:GDP-mannose 6-dehydrogenase